MSAMARSLSQSLLMREGWLVQMDLELAKLASRCEGLAVEQEEGGLQQACESSGSDGICPLDAVDATSR